MRQLMGKRRRQRNAEIDLSFRRTAAHHKHCSLKLGCPDSLLLEHITAPMFGLNVSNSKYRNLAPIATLVGLGLLILTVGIRFAYTFLDEVYFAQPVINLLRGDGYTTAAWYDSTSTQTHVSTAPIYSFFLYLWLGLWGISQYAVRALPVLFALLGAAVLWRACVRLGWVQGGRAASLLIALMLLDYGAAFSYSCGRPDSLSFLLLAALLYLASFPDRPQALWLMALVGVLLPFVQWSAAIFTFCLCGALFILFRQRVLKPGLVIFAGVFLGFIAQRLIYWKLGLWDTVVRTIEGEGAANVFQRILDRLTSDPLSNHHNVIPKDITSLILLAGFAVIFVRIKQIGDPVGERLAKAAAIIALAVGIGMYFLGKFPTYYGWMLCAPLGVILVMYGERVGSQRRGAWATALSIGILACAAGLPFQFLVALHDWNDRQPGPFTAWLQGKISQDDVVYCDYPYYYPVKFRAKRVYTGFYINHMTPAEAQQVTMVILDPRKPWFGAPKIDLSKARETSRWTARRTSLFGNSMQFGFLSSPNYECLVFDLKPAPAQTVPAGDSP